MNRKLFSLIVCGAIGISWNFIGANTVSAATPGTEQTIVTEDSNSFERLSAWPRIRDAILDRDPHRHDKDKYHDSHYHDHHYDRGHRPPPPPPPPPSHDRHHMGPPPPHHR